MAKEINSLEPGYSSERISICSKIDGWIINNKILNSKQLGGYYAELLIFDGSLDNYDSIIMNEIGIGIKDNNFDLLIQGTSYIHVLISDFTLCKYPILKAHNKLISKLSIIHDITIKKLYNFTDYKIFMNNVNRILNEFKELLKNYKIDRIDRIEKYITILKEVYYFSQLLQRILRKEIFEGINNNENELLVKGLLNYNYLLNKIIDRLIRINSPIRRWASELAKYDESDDDL